MARPAASKGANAPDPRTAPADPIPARTPAWAAAGLGLFLAAAAAFGVLEAHYSTDTWIALAAGRQILQQPEFPRADTFSYTFGGEPWINQNWLSHVALALAYEHLGPDATVIVHWTAGGLLFALVLLAVRLRSGSWVAASTTAGLVAIATRDWLRIRPATIQLVLLAAMWVAFCALLRPRGGVAVPRAAGSVVWRWLPVLMVGVVLGTWVHAHGSFLLGFGLLATLLGTWGVARLFGDRPALDGRRALALLILGVLAAASGVFLSPFGFENLTHPLKVVEGDLFREIGEWLPPTRAGGQPPVTRFWAMVGLAAVAPLTALFLRLARGTAGAEARSAGRPQSDGRSGGLHSGLFDVLSILLGLGAALFARRFAPLLYILAGPALAALTVRLGRGAALRIRHAAPRILGGAAWPAALLAAFLALSWGQRDLVDRYHGRPGDSLLDRVTRNDETPRAALEFLRRNHLAANVLADWKFGGPIMFCAPEARVFVDGRSQQLYTEEHIRRFLRLTRQPGKDVERVLAELAQSGTTAVLFSPGTRALAQLIEPSGRWDTVFLAPEGALSLAVGSPLLADVERRERAGELWWPDVAEAHLARGERWVRWSDRTRAAECWAQAVALNPRLGGEYSALIISNLVFDGHPDRAAEFYTTQRRRLKQAADLDPAEREQLLTALNQAADALPGGFIDPFAPD